MVQSALERSPSPGSRKGRFVPQARVNAFQPGKSRARALGGCRAWAHSRFIDPRTGSGVVTKCSVALWLRGPSRHASRPPLGKTQTRLGATSSWHPYAQGAPCGRPALIGWTCRQGWPEDGAAQSAQGTTDARLRVARGLLGMPEGAKPSTTALRSRRFACLPREPGALRAKGARKVHVVTTLFVATYETRGLNSAVSGMGG